jgi:hypothetical protein
MTINPQNSAVSKWAGSDWRRMKNKASAGIALPLGVVELQHNPIQCQLYAGKLHCAIFRWSARVIDGLSDFVEAFSGQHDRLN